MIKGDTKSASIAAASILAKVSRDALMRSLDTRYPGYGFADHKGYPVRAHYAALAQHGACPAHRRPLLTAVATLAFAVGTHRCHVRARCLRPCRLRHCPLQTPRKSLRGGRSGGSLAGGRSNCHVMSLPERD
ncbi:hypothetical protein [Bradyrhizobium japonicum]|uniref:hypothetical protein n=1 Tax=Bradyrhizobium japonicum TaxID=375 RepID=UPI0034E3F214